MNGVKTALLLGTLTGLILLIGGMFGGRTGVLLAFVLAAVMNFTSYWFSDRIVLKLHRARPLSPSEAPRLHSIMERLTLRNGLPMPKLYRVDDPSPNAFATGRDPDHAVVAVTSGILDLLSEEELEGVLAHELAHVKNRDILISSVAATLAGAVMMLAGMMRWAALFGGWGGRDDRNGNPLVFLLTALLAPVAAMLIQLAVSRSREFQADASGASLAGHPHGLARALEKLETASRKVPLRRTHPAVNHLYIQAPLTGGGFSRLFMTHPPLRERVRRLLGR